MARTISPFQTAGFNVRLSAGPAKPRASQTAPLQSAQTLARDHAVEAVTMLIAITRDQTCPAEARVGAARCLLDIAQREDADNCEGDNA
jgi:hypothetical protein